MLRDLRKRYKAQYQQIEILEKQKAELSEQQDHSKEQSRQVHMYQQQAQVTEVIMLVVIVKFVT